MPRPLPALPPASRALVCALIACALAVCALAACERERPFARTPDLEARLGGRDLQAYVEAAPFDSLWQPYADRERGELVFTNTSDVFPWLGGLRNDRDDGDDFRLGEDETHQHAVAFFKDTTWGDSFVEAALLYEPEAVRLEEYYGRHGNPFFGGFGTASYHSARLRPTPLSDVAAGTPADTVKTRTYLTTAHDVRYVVGLAQRGRLVVQWAFPCDRGAEADCARHVETIATALRLDDGVWAEVAADDLTEVADARLGASATPIDGDFWRDPYVAVLTEAFVPRVHLRIGGTPFRRMGAAYERERGAEVAFAYGTEAQVLNNAAARRSEGRAVPGVATVSEGRARPTPATSEAVLPGLRELTLTRKPTTATRDVYDDTASAARVIETVRGARRVYIDEATAAGERRLVARAHLREGETLELRARWPAGDEDAAALIEGIVAHLRLNTL